MNYMNKLMGLSLIMCAAFSSCSDEMENGGDGKGPGDHRISFAVSTQGQANDTRSGLTSGTRELGSAEMQGKLDGKPVYISAELSDGFPGDNRLMTRGTQVTTASQVDEFTVLAYVYDQNTTNGTRIMDYVKVAKNSTSNVWMTQEAYYWPTGKNLNFLALYPCEAAGMAIRDDMIVNYYPAITYEVPDDVSEQQDIMMANAWNTSETTTVPLTFKHMLAAVKFKASADMPACTIKSITLKNVQYKGSRSFSLLGSGISPWNVDSDTRDFTLEVNKQLDGYTETDLTGEGKTFFMMPQMFTQSLNADAGLEVLLEMNGKEQTLSVKLIDLGVHSWTLNGLNGTTCCTYKLSHNWAWEEPSRNLPAGKQLLTNGAHTLTYDFAVTTGKAPIHNGQGKFVITPIYADGEVCSDVAATEVPFTVTEDQTKVTLDLDANPNYNLLRMIQIKVTNPDGTEKTLRTVDFQEAKTDENKIVIYPSMYQQNVNQTLSENSTYTNTLTNITPNLTGDLANCTSMNGVWNGMRNLYNIDASKLSYLRGSASTGLQSSHTKKTCYGSVTITMNSWCLGYLDTDPNARYETQFLTTTGSTNIDGKKTTNQRTDKSMSFAVDQLDIQKAGLSRQTTEYMYYNGHDSRCWKPTSSDVIINSAKNIAYWGHIGCLDYWDGTQNSTQIRVCGYGSSSLSGDAIAWWLDHYHTNGCLANVIIAHYDNPNSSTTDTNHNNCCLTGRFYWGETYKINYIKWSLYRAESGIGEITDMNKQ